MQQHIGARRGSGARPSARIALWTALAVFAGGAPVRAELTPPPPQHPTAGDLARQTTTLFAGDPGAAAGDANADARATAADVCATLAGIRSPIQPGPYGIGLKRITYTKPSVTDPAVQRTLNTYIWYPADPATASYDRRASGTPNAARVDGLTGVPLVIFSHGSCGIPNQSQFLTALVASHGFVVAAPPHPGNTTGDFTICATEAQIADSFANRPADVSFIIDTLLAASDDSESFFADLIDPTRIGVMGHSFGGLTTLRVSALDARVRAGLALAPAFFSEIEAEVDSITIPMMIQGGTVDSRTPFADTAVPAFALLGPPRFLVEIQETGHYAFSDLCVTSPQCGTPETLTQTEAHWSVLRYAVPFLLQYVAGDERPAPLLAAAAAPPGIVFTADPS